MLRTTPGTFQPSFGVSIGTVGCKKKDQMWKLNGRRQTLCDEINQLN